MGVDHRRLQTGVPQHFLQSQNIPSVHHKVACERMAQDVSELTRYWPKRMKPLTSTATSGPTPVHKQAAAPVAAPKSVVVYVDETPTCSGPIRWNAGGKKEWLDACVYNDVLDFLLFADRRSPRPSISISEWVRALQEGSVP